MRPGRFGRQFQHWAQQPGTGLVDGELGGMDTNGKTTRAGIQVVAGQCPLPALVQAQVRIQRERMSRDHRSLGEASRDLVRVGRCHQNRPSRAS